MFTVIIVPRYLVENVSVETVSVQDILVMDSHRDNTPAYLILRYFKGKHLLVRESQLGNHQHIAVMLLEFLSEKTGVSSTVCEFVALTSFLSVSLILSSSMSYGIFVLFSKE